MYKDEKPYEPQFFAVNVTEKQAALLWGLIVSKLDYDPNWTGNRDLKRIADQLATILKRERTK